MKIDNNINKIIQGDCIEIMKKIPDNSIDLIFADPPYWMRVEGVLKRPEGDDFSGCNDKWDNQWNSNNDYKDFTTRWLSECRRILKPSGSIWVIGGMQCIYTIGAVMQDLGFWFINDVIWYKTNPTPNFMGTRLANSHETLIWAMKNEKSRYTFNYKTAKELNCERGNNSLSLFTNIDKSQNKQMGSVWRFSVCSGDERLKDENGEKLHSTQKPFDLLYRIVAISSKKGDLVFDPFGGTMTTACAAKKLGRNYLTIEREEKYIKFGSKRLENISPEDTYISRGDADIKPIKVNLVDMIKDGVLKQNEKFFLKNTQLMAVLNERGKLIYDNTEFDIHTLAAKLKNVKAQRLNGFDYWQIERGKNRIILDDVRKMYRDRLTGKL